jgi:glyoxylase-like metal-dependent hydrolase (beta-lactamase superfamily II)
MPARNASMRIGDFTIWPLVDGEISSDPSLLYRNRDDRAWAPYDHFLDPCTGNYLSTVGGFLIRGGGRTVVLDAGIGSHPVYPWLGGGFRSALLATGTQPSDVTDVIFSHLHLDHIGWATQHGRPFFPRATYRCDRRDWDYFNSPDYVLPLWESSRSNPAEDAARNRLAPAADRFEFFESDDEVLPGIVAIEAGGHTPGSTVVMLDSAGEQGMLLGDLVHTEAELCGEDWDFIHHVDHDAGMAALDRIRKIVADRRLPFAAAHFPGLRWGRLERSRGSWSYERLPA